MASKWARCGRSGDTHRLYEFADPKRHGETRIHWWYFNGLLTLAQAERQRQASMKYPDAIDPSLVGEYPALVKSGAGYFFDHVLEYRVWCHPERGAPDEAEGDDYYYAFKSHDDALAFFKATPGAEEPLALVRQL